MPRRRGAKIRVDWWTTGGLVDDTPMGRLIQEQEVSRRRAISTNNAADFFDAPQVPDTAPRASANTTTPFVEGSPTCMAGLGSRSQRRSSLVRRRVAAR